MVMRVTRAWQGTDLLDVRYAALHAAEQAYAVVFPEYYFGQIFEASTNPAQCSGKENQLLPQITWVTLGACRARATLLL